MSEEEEEDKFRVGDIVSMKTYQGHSGVLEQVGQVLKVFPTHYEMRPIQFRTSEQDWSNGWTSGAQHLRRGDWEEEQSSLFRGKTLEQTKAEERETLRELIREIVREELAKSAD